MKKFALLLFPLLAILLISCDSNSSDDTCPVSQENRIIYEIMQDSYLWYNQLPNVNPDCYGSPDALLEDLKYTLDKWSYIITYEEYNSYYEEGQFPGMGFSAAFDNNNHVWVEYVYEGSPAADAGIQRTDEILQINGINVSAFSDLYALWAEIYRYDSAYINIKHSDGSTAPLTLHWDWVDIKTVLHAEVIPVAGKNVGYMVFNSFIEPSYDELDQLFSTTFQGIDELILDLRYNGGGRLDVAGYLASLIYRPATDDEIFVQIMFNDKYDAYNDAFPFTVEDDSLGLSRVFVITTENTCSASEVVINSLEPFDNIDVIVIGRPTCGKPVGMTAHQISDIVLLPIEFKTANADGTTDYFDGLQPDCEAEDDLTMALGDVREDSLATAIDYIENGSCTPIDAAARTTLSTDSQQKNERHGLWKEIRVF